MASANPTLGGDDLVVTTTRRSPFDWLLRTEANLAPTIARLGLGLVMIPHALQKAFGLFGGYGFSGTVQGFTTMMGIPRPLAIAAVVTEIVCSVLLVVGALSRIAAAGIICIMIGAVVYVHLPNGFFMNWSGQKAGEGFEYHLLAIALGLVVVIAGGGLASVDRSLVTQRRVVHRRDRVVADAV